MRRFSGSQLPPSAVSASSPAFSAIVPHVRLRDVSRPPAADRDTVFRSASTLVDEQTFRLAQAGDPTAIQTLLIRLQPDVRRYARKQCRSIGDRRGGAGGIACCLSPDWTGARSRFAERLDRQSRPASMHAPGFDAHARHRGPDRNRKYGAICPRIPTDELRIDLVHALESLSPHLREVILMRDLQEMTIGEIAHALKATRAAVKARLHRARYLIREYLQGEGEHDAVRT